MIGNILALCSRDQGHEEVYSRLKGNLNTFDARHGSWEKLINEAEIQGIAPLVYKHVTAVEHPIPPQPRRLLQSVYLRHRRSNDIRNRTIAEILATLQKNGVAAILLKGIALINTVYQEPAVRPMRDIDLLVGDRDVARVQELLHISGFYPESSAAIDDDHHHVEPMVKIIAGLPVSVEIHRQLLPQQTYNSSWSYEALRSNSASFSLHGVKAQTLGLEHTLHYLYLHGLRAPLTYEPYRLIHIADLVSFVELNHQQINWQKLAADFPGVFDILSRLHFLTPYHPEIINNLPLNISTIPDKPGMPYCGWPQRALSEIAAPQMLRYLKDTIWPSQWWTQVYYGTIKPAAYFKARFFEHPRALWRWAKSYRLAAKGE
ncbi:MAG: nucleotidyltransferase domain-containing protein [Desulforhopalus sp.]